MGDFCGKLVGKYTSPMDPMGTPLWKTRQVCVLETDKLDTSIQFTYIHIRDPTTFFEYECFKVGPYQL